MEKKKTTENIGKKSIAEKRNVRLHKLVESAFHLFIEDDIGNE